MERHNRWTRLAVILVLTATISSSLPAKVASLEEVTARFPTLEAFLKDKAAVAKYEQAVAEHFGRSKFPCDGFTEVLSQLRGWMKTNPKIAERLWAKHPAWSRDIAWKNPPEPKEERYRFVRMTRLLHGIWEDLSKAGCTPDSCGTLSVAAPGRWASALEGTEVYHLEKGSKFAGASLYVIEVAKGNFQVQLVDSSDDALLSQPAAKETKEGRKSTTLLDEWVKAMGKGTKILARVDAGSMVRGLFDPKSYGPATAFTFQDPNAATLALQFSEKCAKAQNGAARKPTGVAKNNGTTLNIIGGGPAGVGGPAASPPSPQAALAEIAKNVGAASPDSDGSAAAADPKKLELTLRKVLQSSSDPSQRAQAAVGLKLLQPSSPTTDVSGLSPETRTSLVGALKDPSPQVRGEAALALGASPSAAGSAATASAPAERAALDRGLNEAYGNPGALGFAGLGAGSPNLVALTGPSQVKDAAFDGMLRSGTQLSSDVANKMWEEARQGATIEQRKSAVTRIADEYLAHTAPEDSVGAIQALESRLQSNPGLFYKVIEEIENRKGEICERCKAEYKGTRLPAPNR